MKFRLAVLAAGSIALAACGDSNENASTEAQADTVEITADEALGPDAGMPVADPNANLVTAPAMPSGEEMGAEDEIQQAGDDAAATAEAAMDAMAEDSFEQN